MIKLASVRNTTNKLTNNLRLDLNLGEDDETCPICHQKAIVSITWSFYYYDKHMDNVVKQHRSSKAWIVYKRDLNNIMNEEMINIFDVKTTDDLTPEEFHHHHIQMQHNGWYRSMVQMVNEKVYAFIYNREQYFIMPFGSREACPQPWIIEVNWAYGVTNSREIETSYNNAIRGMHNPGSKQAIPCLPNHEFNSAEFTNFVFRWRKNFKTQNIGVIRNMQVIMDRTEADPDELVLEYKKGKTVKGTIDRINIRIALEEPLKKVSRGLRNKMTPIEYKLFKAKKKSDKLLKAWLSPKEYRSLKTMDELVIPDIHNPHITYTVDRNPADLIEIRKDGNLQEYWCIQGDDGKLPASDRLLMKIMNFKGRQEEMEKIAVRVRAT